MSGKLIQAFKQSATTRVQKTVGSTSVIRPDMITKIIQKHFSCVTDVRVLATSIPREFLCVIGVHRKYLMETSELHKIVLPASPV